MLQRTQCSLMMEYVIKLWFNRVENPVSKRQFYKGQKQIAGKPITKDTAEKLKSNWI